MKTIVISGAHSNVGKTKLARELCELLSGAIHVKIGHGEEKENEGNVFFHVGTPFSSIESEIGHVDFAVIESNRVLGEMTPDCAIYLPGGTPKPTAVGALQQADIVRGKPVARETIESLTGRLGLDEATVIEIVSLAGAMPEGGSMIQFEDAYRIVMESAVELDVETVPLFESRGRVLGDDITSDIDMPPFDKSAMDGYACRIEDLGQPLEIVETIPAGRAPEKAIGPCQCAKIMTGGVVPDGADCVVMVEHTELGNGKVHVTKKTGALNICFRAEDVKCGDLVLHKGTLISPGEVAVLSAVGCAEVPVSRQPVIGIAATGSELVDPSRQPASAEIRDSNRAQLFSQAELAGCRPVDLGIIPDSPEAIGEVIEQKEDNMDIFLFSGGVSMGDYDYVPRVLREKGFELLFENVAIKPGKPTVFGRKDGTFVFGLPGNPVSTFVIFELFVRPFCFALMGCSCAGLTITAVLAEAVRRKKSDRLAHFPVRLDADGRVRPVEYHGSAHIHAYARADGFISMPIGKSEMSAGSTVQVTLTRRTCRGGCGCP